MKESQKKSQIILSDFLSLLGINNLLYLHIKYFGLDFEKCCLVSSLLDLVKSSPIINSEIEEIYTRDNALHIVLI